MRTGFTTHSQCMDCRVHAWFPSCLPELTLASTATRKRPSCFNLLHQIDRANGENKDVAAMLVDYNTANSIIGAFQVGLAEAKAAVMLKTKCCPEFVKLLTMTVKQYGVSHNGKSSFMTHEALCAECWAVGYMGTQLCQH